MRFFVLPLLLLPLAPPERPADVAASARPAVLLVHGRGLQGQDSASLRRAWKHDLDEGLKRAGLSPLQEQDVRLAWYADVLDPATDGTCPSASAQDADFAGVMRGFLAGLGALMEREGTGDARSFLGDVLFMMDPGTRCGAQRRVADAVRELTRDGRPLVIVGYSLGSVVAHDLLRTMDSTTAPIRFVTIGSPLGVPMLRELLGGGRVEMPAAVSSWENVYDLEDPFSAPLGLPGLDHPTAATGRANPHDISGYLRDGATGAAIARALCASAPAQFGAGCPKA